MQSTSDLPKATVEHDGTSFLFFGPSAHDHIFDQLATTHAFYEKELLHFLSALCRPGDLVIDVGANLGNHTVYFAGTQECDVVAFEAVPTTVDILVRNVTANFLDSRVRVQPYAVGAEKGAARITSWSDENTGGTSLRADADGPFHLVTLDDFDWPQPPRIIKVDVEGMDLDVLKGARRTIQRHRPYLSVEAMDPEAQQLLDDYLSSIGYGILGTFNATPTFVCAPVSAGTDATGDFTDLHKLIDGLTQRIHDVDIAIGRSNRYMQRVHQEIMDRVDQMTENHSTVNDRTFTEDSPPDHDSDQLHEIIEQLRHENTMLWQRIGALESAFDGRPSDQGLPHDEGVVSS